MSRNSGSGSNRGGEDQFDRDGDPCPLLPPQPPDCSWASSNTDVLHQNLNLTQLKSRHEGFIDSTLRSYHTTPASGQSVEPEDFMKELLNETERSVQFRILNPLPANVRPELFKKSQTQVPTVKWSGQNDLKLFHNWIHSWLAWMSSSGWKGSGFNELHVHNLTVTLEGDAHELAMHQVQSDICHGCETTFWGLLKYLMCMYIKKSAAVMSMKAFKTMTYDSSKGVKHFYTQLLCMAEDMITIPDQALFNERFLNALPSKIKRELVLQDQVSVDFTSKEQLWTTVLQVDHAFNSLKAISAYHLNEQINSSSTPLSSNLGTGLITLSQTIQQCNLN